MPPAGTATPATGDAAGATPATSQQDGGKPDDATTGTPATGDTGTAANASTASDDGLTDAGRAAIDKERDARKAADKRAKDLEARLKAIEDKDLPEADRTAKERDALKTDNERLTGELRQERLTNAVIMAASRLGFADPADAVRLVDVEYDDDDRPKDVDAKLAALLKAKPYLASAAARTSGSADPGNAGGASTGTDFNADIRRAAGKT